MGRVINVSSHMFPLIEGCTDQLFWFSSRKEIVFVTQPAQFLSLPEVVFFLTWMWPVCMLLVYLC